MSEEDDIESLEGALGNISLLFKKRVDNLTKREEEFERMKRTFEQANPVAGNVSDVLRLNVGGSRIDVLRRTLTLVEGSMLASKFSGRWDGSLEKDADGNFFIDQPMDLFLPMVEYLRAKACMTPLAKPVVSPKFDSQYKRDNFVRMLEYYGMTLGIYPFGIFEGDDTSSPVSSHPEYSIESEQWKIFKLLPLPGNTVSFVQSYEVTLGRSTSAKIGWIGSSTKVCDETENEGVGYVGGSVGLDTSRSGISMISMQGTRSGTSASFVAIAETPSLVEGAVVRAENRGEMWYVNGALVASTEGEQEGVAQIDVSSVGGSLIPCLSVKGSVRISNIELNY